MDKTKKKNCVEVVRSENMEEQISFLDALKMSKEEALKLMMTEENDDKKPPACKGAQTKKSV